MTDEEPAGKSGDPDIRDPAFENLDARIRAARLKETQRTPPDQAGAAAPIGLALGMRIGIELVSALAVSGGIGWYLDRWLETRPWLMLAMMVLGSAAGLLNAYRAAMRANASMAEADLEAGDEQPRNEE